MTNEELWQAVLGELELSLSRANFTTWFKQTFVIACNEGKLVVGVPNNFTKTWFENKYHQHILKSVRNTTRDEVREVVYQIETRRGSPSAPDSSPLRTTAAGGIAPLAPPAVDEHGLNPRYVFATFVVGKSNELAHAAARAIVDRPGHAYNPFFIYGGVGLGKTHLMQAIGHEILQRQPSAHIRYASCEQFINEFVSSIHNGQADHFKNRYRTADVLLVDDIHFMTGKEQTQDQFFHTFNELHHQNKQIILSADRPPKAILGLEERLLSRFEWGMTTDIGLPDLETRIAIIDAKLNERGVTLPRDITTYIASVIQSNVRELEGALNRILVHRQLHRTLLTVESVRAILESVVSTPKRGALTAKQILKTVSQYFDVNVNDLTGESRKKELVTPRQIVMYLMREEIKSSFPNIGAELGGRDHTTAMHAYTKMGREVASNERIRQDITLIRQRLYHQSWDKM